MQTEQPRADDLARLQHLLTEAIRTREIAINFWLETENRGTDKHWFCPGEHGYCLACNLPANNARHVPRPA